MKDLDTLIESIFFLMTRHSQSPQADLEQTIIDNLQMLACHPDCDSETLKTAGQNLAMSWRQEARAKQLGIDQCLAKFSKTRSLH